jgi:hypothetical protein
LPFVIVVLGLFLGSPSFCCAATIIWDQTVGATGATAAGTYINWGGSQNFAEPVFFNAPVQLTGVDVYTSTVPAPYNYEYGAVGTRVLVQIRTGSPTADIQEFVSRISVRDLDGAPSGQVPGAFPGTFFVRAHADLPLSITLAAHTAYWIGMVGLYEELGLAMMVDGVGPALDNQIALYDGAIFQRQVSVGDGQFRLWGEPVAVSEAPIWLSACGLVCVAAARRLRLPFAA